MNDILLLGTGRMGAVLAKVLAKAGHRVTVWNRTAARARDLAPLGIHVASSLDEAIQRADLLVGVLKDHDASREVLSTVRASLRGKTLVELASGTPRNVQASAAWAEEAGLQFLSGAIMATPDFIGTPGCTILYSGPAEIFEAHRALLATIADNGTYVGPGVGHASVLDNALLTVLWGATLGMLHGAALCEAEGFAMPAFAEGLRSCWAVFEPSLQGGLDRLGRGHYVADATSAATVETCHASVRFIRAISDQHGIDPSLPVALDTVFQRAVDAGHREDDLAAVFEAVRARPRGR